MDSLNRSGPSRWRRVIFRRTFLVSAAAFVAGLGVAVRWLWRGRGVRSVSFRSEHVELVVSDQGQVIAWIDRASGVDGCKSPSPIVEVKDAKGVSYGASSMVRRAGRWVVVCGGHTVELLIEERDKYLTIEVVDAAPAVISVTLFDIELEPAAGADDPFVSCVVALNLLVMVRDFPGGSLHLTAEAGRHFGLIGAKLALVASRRSAMREILKRVVSEAGSLPISERGGPWAQESEDNRRSYVFNFDGITTGTVDEWIRLAAGLGVTQIDFHGGTQFRFGDYEPDRKVYPEGWKSFRAINERLAAHGIAAGLHSYAQFIDKRSKWVAPTPHPDLAVDAVFTLAADIGPGEAGITVNEPLESLSMATGFLTRNSVTLRIGDELVVYNSVDAKAAPARFLGCQRGALGTTATSHGKGTKVLRLKECFGMFVPAVNSKLLDDVAAATALAYNEGGFSMMYLDALDGSDIMEGLEHAWHHYADFTYRVWGKLQRKPILEMSAMSHHLWVVRSRHGALDHPRRRYMKFVDVHVQLNVACDRMFLPSHLGWWAFRLTRTLQAEPTFPEDIEYLMVKSLATNAGCSYMGLTPASIVQSPGLVRLMGIVKQYETLRLSHSIPHRILKSLSAPDSSFKLSLADGKVSFRRMAYWRHGVEPASEAAAQVSVSNPFRRQPLMIRIEALRSLEKDALEWATTLSHWQGELTTDSSDGSECEVSYHEKFNDRADVIAVHATRAPGERRQAAWSCVRQTFVQPVDLRGREGLGVWVWGDGSGALLNIQICCPPHLSKGVADHFVRLDFAGWKYAQFLESETGLHEDKSWPYWELYTIYREGVQYSTVTEMCVYVVDMPESGVRCALGPIHALPHAAVDLMNPTIALRGKKLQFSATLPSGSFIEYLGDGCKLYDAAGAFVREVPVVGEVPHLEEGANDLVFTSGVKQPYLARALLTVVGSGPVVE